MNMTSMLGAITCCVGLISANQAAAQPPRIPEAEQKLIKPRLDWPYVPYTVNNVTRDWTMNFNFLCDIGDIGSSHCKKRPLIIVLHGNGTNANVALLSNHFPSEFQVHGMNAGANSAGCEVNDMLNLMEPQPAPQICKEFRLWEEATVRDDGDALVAGIERLKQDPYVDSKRVYVFGESGGGFVLLRNLCKLAGKVAAVGINAALPRDVDIAQWVSPTSCSPGVKIPYIHIHGTNDRRVNFGGIPANHPTFGRHKQVGVETTIATMVQRNKANSKSIEPLPNSSYTDASTVTSITYHQDGLPMVRLLKVIDGGHAMPGLLHHLPVTQGLAISAQKARLGPINLDIVGAVEVARFFKLHKLN